MVPKILVQKYKVPGSSFYQQILTNMPVRELPAVFPLCDSNPNPTANYFRRD